MGNATSERGRFVFYDLMTTDAAKAVEFYDKIAGWTAHRASVPGGEHLPPYTMLSVNGTDFGGVMELKDFPEKGIPPHWLASVCVPDVEASVKQVTELGGQLIDGPMEVPTVGTFAIVADPQGAVTSLFTPLGEVREHQGPPRVGEFSWHELLTSADVQTAFDYYSALFGWEKITEVDMGADGPYLLYGRNGTQLGGMFKPPTKYEIPPNFMLYIHVENADKSAELVKELGGTILNGPMDVPGGGRIVQCLDPQGAVFAMESQANPT